MIYTVTFNPAIDLFLDTDLNIGQLNRVRSEQYSVGGKGLVVSQTLNNLGIKSIATGFVGGFTGGFIREELGKAGIETFLIECEGNSRINVKIQNGDDPTEINLNGINVSEENFRKLSQYFEEVLKEGDWLIISGNSAPGIGIEHFEQLCRIASDRNARLIVDTNENYLKSLLKYRPYMIKPNTRELGGITEKDINNEAELEEVVKAIHDSGIEYIIVSAGSKGGWLYHDSLLYQDIFKGKVINTIGAGDSMVSAFVCGKGRGMDDRTLLRYCVAAGCATSFSAGLFTEKEIEELLRQQ